MGKTEIIRLIGGAGTGKTTALIGVLEELIEQEGYDPLAVGFLSFTRVAARVAAERAAELTGVPVDVLNDVGYYKTIHGVCYRLLGLRKGDVLTLKEDAIRIEEAIERQLGNDDEGQPTVAQESLDAWNAARSQLIPLAGLRGQGTAVDYIPPAEIEGIVKRYEQFKRLEGQIDFCDMLLGFAGWHCDYRFEEKPTRFEPKTDLPSINVWILDEQQDNSALLQAVCLRLAEGADKAYIAGDPFQSIYGFNGSSSRFFMRDWENAKTEIMPKSYRCPAPILSLGERILKRCSDYWDREIAPADHSGYVQRLTGELDYEIPVIDPREDWLFLARTHYQARRIKSALNDRFIPWEGIEGGSWMKSSVALACKALRAAANGDAIQGKDWANALEQIPHKHGDEKMYVRGTKTNWLNAAGELLGEWKRVDDFNQWGATPRLIEIIKSGEWPEILKDNEHGKRYLTTLSKWGHSKLKNHGIRVGTIHSVKGDEADNVFWLTSTSNFVEDQITDREKLDEEHRLAYVAVTRARQSLWILEECNAYGTPRVGYQVPA